MPPRGLKSNRGLLTAVDIKATGYDLIEGELIEVTLMPLNEHIKISSEFKYLTMKMCPRFKGKYNPEVIKTPEYNNYLKIKANGMERLKTWYNNLGINCRITLLGFDLDQQLEFLVDWCGGKREYLQIFSPVTRDILKIELFLKDIEAYSGKGDSTIPTISTVAKRLGINPEFQVFSERRCLLLAQVYRQMLYEGQ